MKSGLKPTRADSRDYDFLRTHQEQLEQKFGSISTDKFPDKYDVDAGLWMPNQNAFEPIFGNKPLPAGCTDYSQAELAANEDKKLYDPMLLEKVTRANEIGGIDLRTAVAASVEVFNRGAYFNVRALGPLDPFDAARLAMFDGFPEARSVSVGTPWFYQFARVGPDGILPTPDSFDLIYATWHNWVEVGWTTIDGSPYIKGKSWQGPKYGKGGYHLISRALYNSLMAIYGSAAFTVTRSKPDAITTVELELYEHYRSFFSKLSIYAY